MKKNHLFLVAGIALFVAIAKMPYGYYQLLRWFVCGVGAYGAYLSYQENKIGWAWILGITAVVFNPFQKIYFVKEPWMVIDFIAGILFFTFFVSKKKSIN